MNHLALIALVMTIIGAATPILIVALGELVVEKSGVLNLGLEGMMLIGAVAGFAVTLETGMTLPGMIAAACAAALAALIFGVLTLTLAANQVATGLALTIFGVGLSSLAGADYVGRTIASPGPIFHDMLSQHDILRLLFGHDVIVYFSFLLPLAIIWFLYRTRSGLILRAVGENADSAHALGYPVILTRYLAVAFGGAMAGIGGCYYSLILIPMWADNITSGRGWIALALVVFAAWRPGGVVFGAYLFGTVIMAGLHLQAAGIASLAPEFLAAAPYLATIVVLAAISVRRFGGSRAPACLGRPFTPQN